MEPVETWTPGKVLTTPCRTIPLRTGSCLARTCSSSAPKASRLWLCGLWDTRSSSWAGWNSSRP
ncbi:connector enhancer of kinase suppressor of Ras 1 [Homo sapiens]|uniref:Connector enhancer of kinase suppressor of Ras 1 n=1 Tax=Homo sapiens TaxID=9606 RepID=E9PIE0_HUMAN|nr:connector enhancer of kinase suppressor of Ras 1 [Homo sapiens]KAI4079263.1 connector enhancer of kinase suppressor of Ras 1 [Homo sapiens]